MDADAQVHGPSVVRRGWAYLNRRPLLGDAVLATIVAAGSAVEIATQQAAAEAQGMAYTVGALVLMVLWVTVPLVLRRRFPLWTAVLVVTVAMTGLADVYSAILGSSIAFYTLMAYGAQRLRIVVLAFCYAVILVPHLGNWFSSAQPPHYAIWVVLTFMLAFPAALGEAIRRLRARQAELRLRVQQLQEERAENARKVLFEERVRIARELHDVVSHHVSVMGVQAGAARMMTNALPAPPTNLTSALGAIESSSRRAIVELHQLLGFMRREGEPGDSAPQPGLDQLGELVAQVQRSRLEVQGEPRPVDRTLDVSAYRIVQEALTNSVKYSGGAASTVVVRYQPAALEVEVLDDGRVPVAPKAADYVGGHGLIGMRERVAQHGGQLRVGPRPTGGFGVHAIFPLDGPGVRTLVPA